MGAIVVRLTKKNYGSLKVSLTPDHLGLRNVKMLPRLLNFHLISDKLYEDMYDGGIYWLLLFLAIGQVFF